MDIMFNGGMPTMTGTWYNPKTGDSFTVRDTFFEDNNYIIMTTDGRKVDGSRMSDYVKSEKPVSSDKSSSKSSRTVSQPVQDIDISGLDIISTPMRESSEQQMSNDFLLESSIFQEVKPAKEESISYKMIDKVLNGKKMPTVSVSINWKVFPEVEINTLTSVLSISKDEITDYIIDNIEVGNIDESIRKEIEKILSKCLAGPSESKPKTSPKSSSKKTSKNANEQAKS